MLTKFIVASSLGLLLLVIFFYTSDFHLMASAFKRAAYIYLVPGILIYMLSIWFRALRWKYLLVTTKKITSSRLYPVVVVGYMANNLLPFRLGELVRGYYLSKRENVSTVTGLSTIFVERILDALALIFLIGITSIFIPLGDTVHGLSSLSKIPEPLLVFIFVAPFCTLFGVLIFIALFRKKAEKSLYVFNKYIPQKLHLKLIDLSEKLFDGLESLRSISMIMKVLILSVPIWICETFLFLFVALSLDLNTYFDGIISTFSASILVTGITNIGSSIPLAPGGVGLFELIARETLILMPHGTVERPDAAAFATITHSCLLLSMIILGQIFLWLDGISLLSLSKINNQSSKTE